MGIRLIIRRLPGQRIRQLFLSLYVSRETFLVLAGKPGSTILEFSVVFFAFKTP